MKFLAIALVATFASFGAFAADTCETKAIDKNGKPLAGAAKESSIAKCEKGHAERGL